MNLGKRLLRNLHIGFENVLLHKMRSLLTMLGIVFGVASVIAMLSIGAGASQQALNQIRRLGSHNIIIVSEKPVNESNDNSQNSGTISYGITYADYGRIRETFSSVTHTVPAKILLKEAYVGKRSETIRLVGTTQHWFNLVQRDIIAGRTLTNDDVIQHNCVAVITENLARKLLASEYALGHTIKVGSDVFRVVGVVRNEGGEGTTIQTPDRPHDIYIPISTIREHYGDLNVQFTSGSFNRESVELHQIITQVDNLQDVEPTAMAIERMLQTSHKKHDYRIHVPLALLRQTRETQRTFSIVLGSIACISLLVGGIGIMNIMLASVTERTREIGVRRAIGATKRQITEQFLTETVVLSTTGGIIGALLGISVPIVIAKLSGMPTVVTGWSVALSLLISIAIGIIFGIYPAIRAANLDPIEALRHE
jgi:putative ABC transport system permease protein